MSFTGCADARSAPTTGRCIQVAFLQLFVVLIAMTFASVLLIGCSGAHNAPPDTEIKNAVEIYYGEHYVKALQHLGDSQTFAGHMQKVKRYKVKNSYSRRIDDELVYFYDVAVEVSSPAGTIGELLPLKFTKRGNSWSWGQAGVVQSQDMEEVFPPSREELEANRVAEQERQRESEQENANNKERELRVQENKPKLAYYQNIHREKNRNAAISLDAALDSEGNLVEQFRLHGSDRRPVAITVDISNQENVVAMFNKFIEWCDAAKRENLTEDISKRIGEIQNHDDNVAFSFAINHGARAIENAYRLKPDSELYRLVVACNQAPFPEFTYENVQNFVLLIRELPDMLKTAHKQSQLDNAKSQRIDDIFK